MAMQEVRIMRRRGFTITELLVSMALIMFVMAILSEAFVAGLDAFRQLKAIGDLDQRMRTAVVVLSRDLKAEHFDGDPKLSRYNPTIPRGFFRIGQGTASASEGSDADGIASYRATDHYLYFTVNLSARNIDNDVSIQLRRKENHFLAHVPGTTLAGLPSPFMDGNHYYSPYAEVAYFLRPATGATTPPGTTTLSQQLYTLYRRQVVLLQPTDADTMNVTSPVPYSAAARGSTYYDVSCLQDPGGTSNFHFNDMDDVSAQNYRCLASAPPYPIITERGESTSLKGSDILMTDVVSFSVRVLREGQTQFSDVMDAANSTFVGKYDTSPNTTAGEVGPLNYKIKALEITLRVWDRKMQKTRQITYIQDM